MTGKVTGSGNDFALHAHAHHIQRKRTQIPNIFHSFSDSSGLRYFRTREYLVREYRLMLPQAGVRRKQKSISI
jgi:hypothetical protein